MLTWSVGLFYFGRNQFLANSVERMSVQLVEMIGKFIFKPCYKP